MTLLAALVACAGAPGTGPVCTDVPWPVATPFNVLGAHIVAGTATDAMLADLDTLVRGRVPQEGGPWTSEVVGPVWSADGRQFGPASRTAVVTAASVEDAIVGPDGNDWLFFVDGDVSAMVAAAKAHRPLRAGWGGFGGLGAVASVGGGPAERVDLTFSGSDVPIYMVDPDVHALTDGRYRMYYLGFQASEVCADSIDPTPIPGLHAVYSAVSRDLRAWEQEGVVFRSATGGTDPVVWCVDERVCYLYMGDGGRSTDGGRTFEPFRLTMPDDAMLMPDVVRTSGGFRMYYRGREERIFSQHSTDGVTWVPEGDRGVIGGSPSVVAAADGGVRLWFHRKRRP